MFADLALPALIAFSFYSGGYGIYRYRTPLNPLTIHVVLMVGLFTLGSALSSIYLTEGQLDYGPSDATATYWLSFVNLLGVVFPYWFDRLIPSRLFSYGLVILGLNSDKIGSRFSAMKFGFIILIAIAMFVGLAVSGGGGTLWLTNPREAYLWNRSGAGHFFILTQWFLTFAYLFYLFSRKPKVFEMLMLIFIFSIMLYFLGKKQTIVLIWIVALVYYNFYVSPISTVMFLLVGLVGFTSVLGLISFTGGGGALSSLQYFEYFNTTAWFISRFQEFGYYYGRVFITSFWILVPRALYPDKPYEYGASLIHQVLYPGMTEAGITPGYLIWTPNFLDFGVIGVLGAGLIAGMSQKFFYEYFLTHRKEFIAFTLMLHFSIVEIWVFVPASVVIIWSIFLVFFLRLRLWPIRLNARN